jgi:hypothetical protein
MHKAAKILAVAVGFFSACLVEATPIALLKTMGLRAGQTYDSAKLQLTEHGWKVDATYASTHEAAEAPPFGFKEVICGNGWQAVCSARFLRDGKAVVLTLHPRKVLLVDAAWED